MYLDNLRWSLDLTDPDMVQNYVALVSSKLFILEENAVPVINNVAVDSPAFLNV